MFHINFKYNNYILLLIIIGFMSYWTALKGDFLSDDYVHVYFMQKMDNDIEVLLKNFYSNWLDIPTTAFYRPLISVTLYIDHLIWGWNPFGYHLTNIIFHLFNGVLAFLIASNFHKNFNSNIILIFLISTLFIVYPLHPESVYWIIGRVDSQLTFFYLLSLYMFISFQNKSLKRYYVVSLLAFLAALGSKEPAVTLPAILTSYTFYITFVQSEKSFFSSILISLIKTKIFWFIVIFYFILRFYALGTLGGGYSGVSTDFFTFEYLSRWIGLLYLFVPINQELYDSLQIIKIIFSLLWIGILFLLLIRKYEKKYILLMLLCIIVFIITLIPIATVFNIFHNLEASRFLYLPSAIFFTFLAILLQDNYFSTKKSYFYLLNFLFSFLILISFYQLKQNLVPWENATNEMKIFKQQLEVLTLEREKKAAQDKPIVLTGIPDSINGAQFLRNGYGGLFSNAFRDKQLNNVLPILDNDFYGVKSVEIKNILRNNSSDLFGVYRYKLGKGFIKIRQDENITKISKQEKISTMIENTHHLEYKNYNYFANGNEPWIKYKLSTGLDYGNILYIKLVLSYNNINEASESLRLYWSDIPNRFLESEAINSQLFNCYNNECEYVFSIASSSKWDPSKYYKYLMISMPRKTQEGFRINLLDIRSIGENVEKIFNDQLISIDVSSFKKSFYNKETNTIAMIAENNNEYIKLPQIYINPIDTDYISLNMKVDSVKSNNYNSGKLYWTTMLQPKMSEQKSIKIDLVDDDDFHTYVIPLKHLPLWWTLGDIKQLFFVPFYGESKIEIKDISIGKKLVVPEIKFEDINNNMNDLSLIAGTGSVFKRVKQSETIILNYNTQESITNYSLLISNAPPVVSNLFSKSDKYIVEYMINQGNNKFILNTSGLNKGMYFLRLVKKDKSLNSLTSDTIALLID